MNSNNNPSRSIQIRLFLTCWIVFALHFATDFVREHYQVLSQTENFSFRLDQYAGLHDDIFETPGRGYHHSGNPGASLIASLPYFLFKPLVNYLVTILSDLSTQTETAVYEHPIPARAEFYQLVRERRLDIKFALTSFVTAVFCMAPLSAFGAVILFRLFHFLKLSPRCSLLLSLLYSFGTPVFFRTAYLNQNLMVAVFAFLGFITIWLPIIGQDWSIRRRIVASGFFSGLALLCDYSGLMALIPTACYALLKHKETDGKRSLVWFALGAASPVALLWFYQWRSFGTPFYPPQHHMFPLNEPSRIGYHGFDVPHWNLIYMNLFNEHFGLFIASPILLLALFSPFQKKPLIPVLETRLILIIAIAITLFFGGVQYTRLQWITGVRYMVAIVPFLFVLMASVFIQLPRVVRHTLGLLAIIEAWSMAMVRSHEGIGPWESVANVFTGGLQLPWHTTLKRMSVPYVPFLTDDTVPMILLAVCFLFLFFLWRKVSIEQRLSPTS